VGVIRRVRNDLGPLGAEALVVVNNTKGDGRAGRTEKRSALGTTRTRDLNRSSGGKGRNGRRVTQKKNLGEKRYEGRTRMDWKP